MKVFYWISIRAIYAKFTIERAAQMTMAADVFVVVGTSLAVYPAAGLIDLVPTNNPRFVIDKNIPHIRPVQNLITIEKPATEEIGLLAAQLKVMFG